MTDLERFDQATTDAERAVALSRAALALALDSRSPDLLRVSLDSLTLAATLSQPVEAEAEEIILPTEQETEEAIEEAITEEPSNLRLALVALARLAGAVALVDAPDVEDAQPVEAAPNVEAPKTPDVPSDQYPHAYLPIAKGVMA